MTELANKLQQKIKTYKKQIEEAEEIAALILPSSARHNKNLRRLTSVQGWPKQSSQSTTRHHNSRLQKKITILEQIKIELNYNRFLIIEHVKNTKKHKKPALIG